MVNLASIQKDENKKMKLFLLMKPWEQNINAISAPFMEWMCYLQLHKTAGAWFAALEAVA